MVVLLTIERRNSPTCVPLNSIAAYFPFIFLPFSLVKNITARYYLNNKVAIDEPSEIQNLYRVETNSTHNLYVLILYDLIIDSSELDHTNKENFI